MCDADKTARRKNFVHWIKQEIYNKCKTKDKVTRQITLMCFPIGGSTKHDTLTKSGSWFKPEELQKLFQSIGINCNDTAEVFTEKEIVAAENFVVDLIKKFFPNLVPERQIKIAYFDSVTPTPFGNVRQEYMPIKPRDKPQNFISAEDAAAMLEINIDEMQRRAKEIYELETFVIDGKIFYDFDAFNVIFEIWLDEVVPRAISTKEEFKKWGKKISPIVPPKEVLIFDDATDLQTFKDDFLNKIRRAKNLEKYKIYYEGEIL